MKFIVSIQCRTYNQALYITDAMNGFVMQQTNFPFITVLFDDASTDGEQEVISEYVKKHFDDSLESGFKEWETEDAFWTFAQHIENRNCHFVVAYLKKNLYGNPKKIELIKEWCNTKYIAVCEGDDYWTDPLKLQKQVDFMEANEEYSMCFHKASIIKEVDRTVWLCCDDIEERDYSATELFERWIVPTNSIVYRKKEVNKYRIRNQNNVLNGDIFLVEKCAHCGRVRGMSEIMSIYRVQSNGMTYDQSRQKERIIHYPKHYKELKSDFPQIDKKVINSFIGKAYFNKAGIMKSLLARRWYITIGSLYCPSLLFKKISRMWKKSNE